MCYSADQKFCAFSMLHRRKIPQSQVQWFSGTTQELSARWEDEPLGTDRDLSDSRLQPGSATNVPGFQMWPHFLISQFFTVAWLITQRQILGSTWRSENQSSQSLAVAYTSVQIGNPSSRNPQNETDLRTVSSHLIIHLILVCYFKKEEVMKEM